MNEAKIKIENKHIKAIITTKKMDHAFLLAEAIAQVCEVLDVRDEKK